MYKLISSTLLFFALSPLVNAAEEEVKLEKGFEWIFDGKTFQGWEGNLNWFRIEAGAIIAGDLEKAVPNNEFCLLDRSPSPRDRG